MEDKTTDNAKYTYTTGTGGSGTRLSVETPYSKGHASIGLDNNESDFPKCAKVPGTKAPTGYSVDNAKDVESAAHLVVTLKENFETAEIECSGTFITECSYSPGVPICKPDNATGARGIYGKILAILTTI